MKNNLKIFVPSGPFEVGFDLKPGGKRITKEHVTNFWENNNLEKMRTRKGIYVFGMKVTKGIVPCYVGKTNNSFGKECFTTRNIDIYNGEIIKYKRNYKPFLFFLYYRFKSGSKISDKIIRELEIYIINLGAEKNNELFNTVGKDSEDRFLITGISRGSGRGTRTKDGIFFKKMMDF
jgi:hypothetical protein